MFTAGATIVGAGGVFVVTVSSASALVASPYALVTTARKSAPLSLACAPVSVYEPDVAPGMSTRLRCQRMASGELPDADTPKVAEPPTGTVCGSGSCVIAGGCAADDSIRPTLPEPRAR